jgi:hypothetical protein
MILISMTILRMEVIFVVLLFIPGAPVHGADFPVKLILDTSEWRRQDFSDLRWPSY